MINNTERYHNYALRLEKYKKTYPFRYLQLKLYRAWRDNQKALFTVSS